MSLWFVSRRMLIWPRRGRPTAREQHWHVVLHHSLLPSTAVPLCLGRSRAAQRRELDPASQPNSSGWRPPWENELGAQEPEGTGGTAELALLHLGPASVEVGTNRRIGRVSALPFTLGFLLLGQVSRNMRPLHTHLKAMPQGTALWCIGRCPMSREIGHASIHHNVADQVCPTGPGPLRRQVRKISPNSVSLEGSNAGKKGRE